jgi:threonine aldolase
MAAAGLYALDNNIDRLAEDHKKALEIAKTLSHTSYVSKVEPTETNIVIFYLEDHINQSKFLNDLAEQHVKISDMGQGKLRIVTHLDYTKEMHEAFLEILGDYDQ